MVKESGGASESGKGPGPGRTPSPGKKNVDKSKRLLPMELRKRRRAAKLQVLANKKARVSLDPPQTSAKAARSLNQATPSKEPNEAVDEEEATTPSSLPSASASSLTRDEKKSPRVRIAGTATSLQSLYSSSVFSQQRQRRLHLSGAHVPSKFQVTELPLDIVPKTKLSILTAFPYPFQHLNSQIKRQALQSFITASARNAKAVPQSAAVRWQQALHYFAHPAAPVPTSLLANRAAEAGKSEAVSGSLKAERKREEKAFFTARWNTWQEAFRDVYMNFRRQVSGPTSSGAKDGTFYLRSSEFVVCFLHDTGSQGAAEDSADGSTILSLCQQHDKEPEPPQEADSEHTKRRKLYAVMSQSNARTRKVLHHLNVEYTMPYINANQTQREAGAFNLLEEEMARGKDKGGSSIIAPVGHTPETMHGPDSLLLFHGHDAVHGLFEFLINRAPMANQDVPELYALHPFANASIQSLQVTSFGRIGGASTESLADNEPAKAATRFRTEIGGFCFPSSVATLLAVLKEEWEATTISPPDHHEPTTGGKDERIALRAYLEAVAGAERLNAVKLHEQSASSPKDQEERRQRQQALEFSKRRVETVLVTRMESRYNVETTTRPIAVRR